MPSRLTLSLGLLCLLLCLALYGVGRWGASEAAAATLLRAEVKALVESKDALEQRLRGVQTELERQRVLRAPLETALEQDPDWSSTPVPPTVRDGLCQRIRCR